MGVVCLFWYVTDYINNFSHGLIIFMQFHISKPQSLWKRHILGSELTSHKMEEKEIQSLSDCINFYSRCIVLKWHEIQ